MIHNFDGKKRIFSQHFNESISFFPISLELFWRWYQVYFLFEPQECQFTESILNISFAHDLTITSRFKWLISLESTKAPRTALTDSVVDTDDISWNRIRCCVLFSWKFMSESHLRHLYKRKHGICVKNITWQLKFSAFSSSFLFIFGWIINDACNGQTYEPTTTATTTKAEKKMSIWTLKTSVSVHHLSIVVTMLAINSILLYLRLDNFSSSRKMRNNKIW